ncbi:hypothetical protein KA977_06255, partial [Candidatus Dependentiae bacterium]|nr:hypothetical protein [Candidatus Dependentiae bacterium]
GKLMTIYNSTTNKSETDFIAMDVQTRRLQILKDNLKHYIGKIDNLKVVCGNLKKIPFMFRSNEKKTVILFDAPCSGSGIINRYPGKLFSMNKNNIMELSELQFEGLKNIIESVKPGTTVIYSVCSVLFEETYLIIQKIKKKYSNIVSGNIDNSIFKSVLKFYSTDEGNLIYPSSISDGFFIAKLIRL